jgi:hypothetical protein
MAIRRRRMTAGGLVKTSVQLSSQQVEMLARLSQALGISVSAIVGQAVDDKLRSAASQRSLARVPVVETESNSLECQPEAAAVG